MIEFRFPEILFLYIPFIILMLFDYAWSGKHQIFSDVSLNIKRVLFQNINLSRVRLKQNLLFLSTVFLIFAASGPQIGTALAPVDRKGLDLVFCIDVSSSMRGTDIKPSRLAKSKFEISQLIKNLKGDRVAFIVFAGSSHLYLPLTTDYEAAFLFLDQIDTNMIPTQGTSLSSALQTGLSAFSDDNSKYKVLVLISDGEDHEGEAVDLAKQASKKGMVIHTVGVGTKSGSLIPTLTKNGSIDYKKDSSGKLITSKLNEQILEDISRAGKGSFLTFNNQPSNFRNIIKQIDVMEKRIIQSHMYSQYEDQFQKFGLFSLCLFIASIFISSRKRMK